MEAELYLFFAFHSLQDEKNSYHFPALDDNKIKYLNLIFSSYLSSTQIVELN